MSVSTNNRTVNKNVIEDMANKNNSELEKRNQAFLIYQDENGIARVNVRFEGEEFLLVRQAGNRSVRRNMSHYNMDMIIAVGFRVK